jgi:hypothetical protein
VTRKLLWQRARYYAAAAHGKTAHWRRRVVQEEQLSCVFQRSAKERCRFVQKMHESPNSARNTGQEKKGTARCTRSSMQQGARRGGRRRWSSAGGEARCLQYEPERRW